MVSLTAGSIVVSSCMKNEASIEQSATSNFGGEGGIRTLGTLFTHTRFPGVHLRPLGHLSEI